MKVKVKNTLILIAVTALLICSLSACGNKGVSISQLKEDIESREDIQNCYYSKLVPTSQYKIVDCKITKEQLNEDDKQDIIYCDVTLENEYFNISVSAQATYNYYDKGGWILENFSFEGTDYYAIKEPETEEFEAFAPPKSSEDILYWFKNESSGRKDGELTGGKLTIESCKLTDELTAVIDCTYDSKCVHAKGKYTLSLGDQGWEVSQDDADKWVGVRTGMEISEYTSDFSTATGTFVNKDSDETFIINRIDGEKITYSCFSNRKYSSIKTGENITADFDQISGRFNAGAYSVNVYYTYNSETDSWNNGTAIFERVK